MGLSGVEGDVGTSMGMSEGCSVLVAQSFEAKDRPKRFLMISKVFLRVHGNFI